MASSSIIFES